MINRVRPDSERLVPEGGSRGQIIKFLCLINGIPVVDLWP